MEMSFLLIQTICQMFVMLIIGILIVRGNIVKTEDSKILSTILLYAVCPCTIINSFAIDKTPEKMEGLVIAFVGAIIINIFFIILSQVLKKIFGLAPIEKASIIYSNAGNIVIPIVTSVLGGEWVFYTSAYIVVQTILMFTHCKSLICNEKNIDWKKIFYNVNIIAIVIGIIMFLFNLRLPSIVSSAFASVGSMMGPLGMIIIGMLIGNMNFIDIFKEKRCYLVALLRLVVMPLSIVFAMKLLGVENLSTDAPMICLILLLQACAPAAQTVTQFAQLYNKHPGYASVINVLSIIMSIFTMPLMIMLYQMF